MARCGDREEMVRKVLVTEEGRLGRRVLMCGEVYEEVREMLRTRSSVKATAADLVRSMF